ncbi:unnamed protein product, partial [Ectocarpus sp. 12 AP-2014]
LPYLRSSSHRTPPPVPSTPPRENRLVVVVAAAAAAAALTGPDRSPRCARLRQAVGPKSRGGDRCCRRRQEAWISPCASRQYRCWRCSRRQLHQSLSLGCRGETPYHDMG